jgi:hypothetical protein
MRTFKLPFAVLLALALCVTAGLAIADDNTPPPTTATVAETPVQASPLEQFGVFRRPQAQGDALPVRAREMLTVSAQRAAADLDTARAVAPSGAGYVWAFAGDQSVCVAIPDPIDGFGVACRSTEDVLAGRLWVGLNGLPGQKAGDARVAVFVPDDVDSVTSVAGNGTRRTIAVRDNVAFADVADSDAVEMTRDGETIDTPVPGTPPQLVSDQP